MSHDDLVVMAELADSVSDAVSPDAFGDQVFKKCIDTAQD
jgi:hypothetical protein